MAAKKPLCNYAGELKALQAGDSVDGGDISGTVPAATTAGDADTVDGSHAAAFAPAAQGVTNGNTHDHIGGDGAVITEGSFSFSDVTTANATTVQHGLLPKLGGGTVNFFRADGAWAAPPGGGSNALLDGSVHSDTDSIAPLLGAIVMANSTPKWTRQLPYSGADKRYLQSLNSGAPSWAQVAFADLSGAAVEAQIGSNIISQGKLKTAASEVSVASAGTSSATEQSSAVILAGTGSAAGPSILQCAPNAIGTTYVTKCRLIVNVGTSVWSTLVTPACGQYGHWPQLKYTVTGGIPFAVHTLYANFLYHAASGPDPWIFLVRDKKDGNILCGYSSLDHPCANTPPMTPDDIPHPWYTDPDRDWKKEEIVVLDNEFIEEAAARAIQTRRSLLQVILEDYEPDEGQSAVYTPRRIHRMNYGQVDELDVRVLPERSVYRRVKRRS